MKTDKCVIYQIFNNLMEKSDHTIPCIQKKKKENRCPNKNHFKTSRTKIIAVKLSYLKVSNYLLKSFVYQNLNF